MSTYTASEKIALSRAAIEASAVIATAFHFGVVCGVVDGFAKIIRDKFVAEAAAECDARSKALMVGYNKILGGIFHNFRASAPRNKRSPPYVCVDEEAHLRDCHTKDWSWGRRKIDHLFWYGRNKMLQLPTRSKTVSKRQMTGSSYPRHYIEGAICSFLARHPEERGGFSPTMFKNKSLLVDEVFARGWDLSPYMHHYFTDEFLDGRDC